jgi:hypothetical protein
MITWLFLAAMTKVPDEIEDIQPPIAADLTNGLIALLVFLLVLAIIAWRFYPDPKKRASPPPLPRETAQQRLRELRAQLGVISLYRFAIELSDILRSFIEQQYGLRAVRQTTPEFLAFSANRLPLTAEQQNELHQFLRISDNIKFARVEAAPDEGELLLRQAQTFVEHEH